MQAEALTLPVVVSRLINARRHWLALQISSLLGMGPEKVRGSLTGVYTLKSQSSSSLLKSAVSLPAILTALH